MKVSKETKILAILLALFLLIGIGCGAAVATNDPVDGVYYLDYVVQTDTAGNPSVFFTPSEDSALMETALVAHVEGVLAHVEAATE